MMESQLFLTLVWYNACFLMSCLSESVLSEIPEKASESYLSEVFLPKVFRSKVFDFNVSLALARLAPSLFRDISALRNIVTSAGA